jgi:hypothetical protein
MLTALVHAALLLQRLPTRGAVLICFTLSTVGALLAGCGQAGRERSPSTVISKADALAFAVAVKLRASDLPGAKEFELPAYETSLADHEAGVERDKTFRCAEPGIVTHPPVSTAGTLLAGHQWAIESEVRVMASASIAAAELGAFGSRRGHVCFARADQPIVTSGNEPPEGPEPLNAKFVPLASLLGPGAIGVDTIYAPPKLPRLAKRLRHGARRQDGYATGVLFRVGPAEISLDVFGRTRFPAAVESRVLTLLRSRADAETHKL